jgi:hypothetical protein
MGDLAESGAPGMENIIAALEHTNPVCQVVLVDFSSRYLKLVFAGAIPGVDRSAALLRL